MFHPMSAKHLAGYERFSLKKKSAIKCLVENMALIKVYISADVSTRTLNSLSSETRQEGFNNIKNEFARF